MIIDKKNISETEFERYIGAETTAYYINDLLVKQKLDNEYVDVLASTYCNFFNKDNFDFRAMYFTKLILNDDYNVDMYSLPFRFEDIKLKTQRYEYIEELKNYFDKNNIKYDSNKVFFKGQELSSIDSNVEKIMDYINDIDLDLINYDNQKQVDI